MNIIESLEKLLEDLMGRQVTTSNHGALKAYEISTTALRALIASARAETAGLEKRYVIERGFIRVHDEKVMFGTNERGWRKIPMMPIEVEHDPHKGVWMVMLVREGRDDFPKGVQEPPSRPSTDKLREMSCPTCCAVRSVVEVRSMMCTTCHNEFHTSEQLDAALEQLDAAVKGMKM